jgi:hypothetical protein
MLCRAALVTATILFSTSGCLGDNRQLGDAPLPSGGAITNGAAGASPSFGSGGGDSGGSAGSSILIGTESDGGAPNLCSGLSIPDDTCAAASEATLLPLTKDGCDFSLTIPLGFAFDRDQIAVVFTPTEGLRRQVPRVDAPSACALNPTGGWFYDGADSSTLSLCPCSCAELDAETGVLALLGCIPTVGIR